MNPAHHQQQPYEPQVDVGHRETHAHDQHLDPALSAGNHDSPHPHPHPDQSDLEALQRATNEHDQHENQRQSQDQPQDEAPAGPGLQIPETPIALQDLGQPMPANFTELEDLIAHLQNFAKDHGFALVRSTLRRREDKAPILLNLLCDRHGHLRNHRGLTQETRVRKKRKSRGIGCPYRISCTLRTVGPHGLKRARPQAPVAPGTTPGQPTQDEAMNVMKTADDSVIDPNLQDTATPPSNQHPQPATSTSTPAGGPSPTEIWTYKVTFRSHNHAPSPITADATTTDTHWKHRRITPHDMKRIRAWYIDGKSPRDMLTAIQADSPDCLYKLKDLQNARRRAKVQFEAFLEGKEVAGV